MEESKLAKYLKVVEENKKADATKECSVFLKDMNENFVFRTMTLKERRDLTFTLPYNVKCFDDIYKSKSFKQTIYNVCNLSDLAVKAKEQGLIATYYDIVDLLFTPEDMATLWLAIMEENKIGDNEGSDLKN